MSWFKRTNKNINTKTEEKKDIPAGLWYKTPTGKVIETQELAENMYVSPEDDYHVHIGSKEYFDILFDGKFKEIGINVAPVDFLKFQDQKKYSDRLKDAQKKTNLKDASIIAKGEIGNVTTIVFILDFSFLGGSMGAHVGETFKIGCEKSVELKCPFISITSSGGARMQEGAISLMQLAKTSTQLAKFSKNGGLFIPILTDPTTGGVTASFGMLGDVILAEPGALIGFAGPRVIKQTIGQDLPKGFQRSEFLLEKGFIDHIVDRKNMKDKVTLLINLLS